MKTLFVAYGDKTCELTYKHHDEVDKNDFINTGYTYMERDNRPWKLFVWVYYNTRCSWYMYLYYYYKLLNWQINKAVGPHKELIH